MNINVLLLHINKSNLDDAIKSNLVSILDKAMNDADSMARHEATTEELRQRVLTKPMGIDEALRITRMLITLDRIQNGDKPADTP